jgi:uncharacterized protein
VSSPSASIGTEREVSNRTSPRRSLRSILMRQITMWHWVSSGICLGGMLLFTITGITLNHASAISAQPVVTTRDTQLSADLLKQISGVSEGRHPLPTAVSDWLIQEFKTSGDGIGEWSKEELYISLPKPGGDSWATVDLTSAKVHFEQTDRGWISYFNDLHKGRHTSSAWNVYIDLLAVACLIFTITGLALLYTHAAKRPSTWPIVLFSLIAPFLVLVFFTHR